LLDKRDTGPKLADEAGHLGHATAACANIGNVYGCLGGRTLLRLFRVESSINFCAGEETKGFHHRTVVTLLSRFLLTLCLMAPSRNNLPDGSSLSSLATHVPAYIHEGMCMGYDFFSYS
jgi:hypothetical protein